MITKPRVSQRDIVVPEIRGVQEVEPKDIPTIRPINTKPKFAPEVREKK